ncbi:MAG: membrane protein insertase YidC, partial [Candidatus Brocadiia bacterium]|nr:membrane protein insertase YidC [Candidatus Brocadiia bacterium]
MDRKNFIQFLVISAVILAAWYGAMMIFGLGKPPQRPVPRQGQEPVPAQGQDETPVAPSDGTIGPAPAQAPQVPLKTGIVRENGTLRVSFTNLGAALERVQLLNYRAPYFEEVEGEKARPVLTLVRDFQTGRLSDVVETVVFRRGGGEFSEEVPTDDIVYEIKDTLSNPLVFEGIVRDRRTGEPRLKIRKTVTLPPEGYHFDVKLEFINPTDEPLKFDFALRGAAGIEQEMPRRPGVGTVVGYRDGNGYDVDHVPAITVGKKGDKENENPQIAWAGAANQYFVAMTSPPEHADWLKSVVSRIVTDSDMLKRRGRWGEGTLAPKQERSRASLARNKATVVLRSVTRELGPGAQLTHEYQFICAPKMASVLDPYGRGVQQVVKYGWPPSVGAVLLAILRFFYGFTRNYGVAILLMTVVVRLVLHPLTRKSQVGMRRMQLLQPKIAELKRKYGDDRERFTREQMALFKKYGAHPLGGCWPMLLQFPVLIALFSTLRSAFELRQAGFIPGWIEDLSQADTIFRLPFYVPLISTNAVNVLPFLFVTASFVSQHMMPKPTDPQAQQQQKIMRWMPLFFAFILYNYASG